VTAGKSCEPEKRLLRGPEAWIEGLFAWVLRRLDVRGILPAWCCYMSSSAYLGTHPKVWID
jgi:hypothetical protein